MTALTQLPRQAGIAIARSIGNEVFSVLTSNSALSDGTALFHADHGNLDSAAAPSATSLDTAAALLGAQQNAAGAYLNYRPRFVIGPPDKASTLAALRASMNVGAVDGVDEVISVLTDSRLVGTTKWYTSAAKEFGALVVVVLQGSEGSPRFERLLKAPLGAPDGLHFVIGYDFVVMPANYRALVYNPGS